MLMSSMVSCRMHQRAECRLNLCGALVVRRAAESREEIDKQLAWHGAQIALLKAKRNALAPISVLPNELMIRIFTIFAVEFDALFDLKWTKIIYVCRHWHAFALAAHPLWSYIDLSSGQIPDRLYQQLRRSGTAPLSLKIPPYGGSYTDLILSNSERIRELDLESDAQQVYSVINGLSIHNFPILSSLSLNPGHQPEEGLPGDFVLALSDALFDGRLPSLRQLKLVYIAFPSRLVSGLTTLSLTECHDSSTSLLPILCDLLSMLSSCPRLSWLELDPIPALTLNQDLIVVDLPELERLCLDGDVASCTALLNHLQTPPRTLMTLFPSDAHSAISVRDLLVPLHRHIQRLGAAEKPLLFHIDRGPTHCTLAFCRGTVLHDSFNCDSARALSLNSHPSTEGALRQIMTKFLKAIPESITHLDACSASDLRDVSWKNMMSLLPALETVFVLVHSSATLCLQAPTQIEALYAAQPTFPRIRHLHLCALRNTEEDAAARVRTLLEVYVKARFTNGTPLKTLEIEDKYHRIASQTPAGESLDRMFALLGGKILRNGIVYDPVKIMQQREEWAAFQRENTIE
ncbi:F-box domain-containing protein [Mycena sanguinolenta]|uniref:F-box domain-containing protein n=1 Tax=Mycena sanguinolenta TaxID=230812 RepID=A0A8H6XNL9_9AGAR|nr:F-box domain-containing protein [Mycena sanguinolenta]